jgi:hypothetical protein
MKSKQKIVILCLFRYFLFELSKEAMKQFELLLVMRVFDTLRSIFAFDKRFVQ